MGFLKSFIEFLDLSMTEPQMYGWFHILFFAITVAATVLLCLFFKKGTEKQVITIVSTIVITAIILEIYKQINFTFSVENGAVISDYQWYSFPFQFCSTPMYVGLLFILTKPGRLHDCLAAFLGTYSLFAGLAVMLYPSTVFIDTIGINIQTMFHHGSMIVMGVYLLYTGYVKAKNSTILKAMSVFAVLLVMAVVLNEIAHMTGLLERETFNMFFVSPYYEDSTLPVYSIVHSSIENYPLRLILYFLGFSIVAYIILSIAMAVKAINKKITVKNNKFSIAETAEEKEEVYI